MRVAILLVFSLAACAPGYTGNAAVDTLVHGTRGAARQFPVGDGRTGWELTCDGGARGMSACYQRAAQTCPSGFDVLNATETGNQANTTRTLLVVCRSGESEQP